MPFNSISIREAITKIRNKEWVLPITQRPYVWGDRTNFQKAIYRLFDSLYRGYSIGPFLIWHTSEEIPYREFLQDFDPELPISSAVEKGNWSKLKFLVYDGQQRLQTLYSCLQYKFCDKVLCFDLLFDPPESENDKYGFIFFPSNTDLEPRYLRLNSLYQDYFREGKDGVTTFRKEQKKRLLDNYSEYQTDIAEKNIDKLWKLFNDEENPICGYFTISPSFSKSDVQEMFVRLNTGGIPPSQADLVFSLIHVEYYDFQEKVQEVVADIQTGTGIDLETYDILQLIYFIKYNTPRVDSERIKSNEIKEFQDILGNAIDPLKAFYKRFLHDEFQINNISVYRSQLALLPLLLYFYKNEFKDLSKIKDIEKIKQYFVLSQINDWSLQGIISEAGRLINEKGYFPLDEIKSFVSKTTRAVNLTEQSISSNPVFVLKLLLPKKSYTYIKSRGRLNPELEHIFPEHPKETDLPDNYSENIKLLWDLQLGVPGDINRGKWYTMPNIYFETKLGDLKRHYDFLPTNDLKNPLWDYHNLDTFLTKRKELMLKEFENLYKLKIENGGLGTYA